MEAGLIPVKRLAGAKARLGSALGEPARSALARALLHDALSLCAAAPFLSWWVVADDPEVEEAAARHGVGVLAERGSDLNAVLGAAVSDLAGSGAASVLILPVDLPLARPSDLQDLIDTGATSDVVVVPAHRDGGTNALLLRPPSVMPPSFGRASLAAHVAEAAHRGLRCSILDLPRLGLDLDTAADAERLVARPEAGATRTGAILAGLGLGSGQPPGS